MMVASFVSVLVFFARGLTFYAAKNQQKTTY